MGSESRSWNHEHSSQHILPSSRYRVKNLCEIEEKVVSYWHPLGSTQAIAIIENIMEHIAFSLKLDPLQVRQVNFIQRNDEIFGIPGLTFQGENPMPDMIQNLKMVAEYEERKSFIDEFNRVSAGLRERKGVKEKSSYIEFLL